MAGGDVVGPAEASAPGEATDRAAGGRRDIRIGLAGLGRFGTLHAAVLGRLPGARLAAVCDPVAAEVEAVAARHDVPGRFADYGRMLAEAALDAVVLVTPEPLHAEQALAALARRLPVFLEKPLATTHAEGRRVVEAAAAAGVPVQVGYLLRFDVQHALLHREIAAGRFGPLVSLRAKRNVSRAWFADYGDRVHPVHETSIHDLDLLLWYAASPVERVYAVARNLSGRRYPDACFALLRFASGAVGYLETSWLVPAGAPANVLTPTWHGTIDAELEVVGTERSARLRLLDASLALWTPDLAAHPDAALWPELHGQIAGALREELAHFLARVRTGAPSPVVSLPDALEGLRVAEAIVESTETGREVVIE
jgi:predicted dehydrogenase